MKQISCLLALLAAGCATPAKPEAFRLEGSRLIGCCCAAPCPCRINKKPMNCHGCDHTDVVRVERGHVGDVRMDGVTWVVVGRGFGEKSEGNWVVVYLDEKASPEQEKALVGMLSADLKAWGPKARHLAGEFKGVKRVPLRYEIGANDRTYLASIPGILDFKASAHINPGHTEPVVSTGIMDAFGDRFIHADCETHIYKDAALKYDWNLNGRQANFARFTLTPDRVARGAIGWGCWTAHSEFKDGEPYQEQLIRGEKH